MRELTHSPLRAGRTWDLPGIGEKTNKTPPLEKEKSVLYNLYAPWGIQKIYIAYIDSLSIVLSPGCRTGAVEGRVTVG